MKSQASSNPLVSARDVTVRGRGKVVLEHVDLDVAAGEIVTLIGPNGAGKSTLLAVIAGLRPPDGGAATVVPGARIGYLRQGVADLAGGTLRDLLDDQLGGLLAGQAELDAAVARLANEQGEEMISGYEQAALHFEVLGGYEALTRLEEAMHAFGVGAMVFDRPLESMSGGEKTRAARDGPQRFQRSRDHATHAPPASRESGRLKRFFQSPCPSRRRPRALSAGST